ncbi:RNA polymerase sigma factor [Paenibacillus sp. FJAT-27812]|uniref:RNA polymerase sigma factor n=1 Tax=Paenibacillus sp. FJAT-27812 TaxID=1684143 RepID=UPI0006A7D577|nr:sigma-70 family RNA polymerase sigma factor [Paenibacillus sp. FJAT-27812]
MNLINLDDNEQKWDQLEDGELVRHAQAGKHEAFGELVRRHRAQFYGYAKTITQESFLAEDIVQEALIRAFMHLGKLVEIERFLPWVHRIVRNQAMTRLKSSPVSKERTFTELALMPSKLDSDADGLSGLDSILRRLNRSAEERSSGQELPEERLMQKETLHVLTQIISCLKPRERVIFESHFFDQLSPPEIAKLFQLSSANVYQIISRSRKKVMQERLRVTVDTYVKTRRDMGWMSKAILPNSDTFANARTWNTAVDSLYAMLKYTNKELTYPMVMGLTGQAFRINIVPESIHIAGPTAYPFGEVMVRGLKNAGYRAKFVDGMNTAIGPNTNLIDQTLIGKDAMVKREIHHALPDALDLIHRSIKQGYPVLAWDLFFPEFGLIYGYDDEERLLHAYECCRLDTLAYENLGRSVLEEIFVLALDEPIESNRKEQLRLALEMIVEHYDGEPSSITASSVKGIQAYDVWCDAFRAGTVEPNGNAYNIAVIMDGRKQAAPFLNEMLTSWPEASEEDIQIRELLREAAQQYEQIASNYEALHHMFPFPEGGEPNNDLYASKSIGLLQAIKKQEEAAVKSFRNLLDQLK